MKTLLWASLFILASILGSLSSAQAEVLTTGTNQAIQSTTTNPTSASYYNNSSANQLLNYTSVAYADQVLKKDAAGNYTVDSIKAFQALNGLATDGKIGQETAAMLNQVASDQAQANNIADLMAASQGLNAATTNNNWLTPCQVAGTTGCNDSTATAPADPGTVATKMTIMTTEQIPWGNCTCASSDCNSPATRKYTCEVKSGMESFQSVFSNVGKYIMIITVLFGVIALAGLGVAWAIFGGTDEHMAKTLKSYAINLMIGLTILGTFSLILKFLAPWIYT